MSKLAKLLSGGDLRSIGQSNFVASIIRTQHNFDELFECLHYPDRMVVMRAVDCVEKVTVHNPAYLTKHKKVIFDLCETASDKELIWHLALLLPRLKLNDRDFEKAWSILNAWAKDKANSRIVRVNAIQGLCDLSQEEKSSKKELLLILSELEKENVKSINARIKQIRKRFPQQQ